MARYWVGGTNTWNSTAGTKWATSSGGAGGAAAPTAADDVFFDANSGGASVVGLGANASRSINFTGFTGTFSHNVGVPLVIGDGTAGASNIALKLDPGMTYTLGNATSSSISFVSTSTTQQTIDFDAKATGNVTFNGAGGSWIYSSAHTATAATITLTAGTLDINGQTCSWGLFSSSNTNTRALTLGAASITINATNSWTTTTTTNFTFTANSSTITFSSASGTTLQMGSLTYNNLVFTGGAGSAVLGGTFTCTNFTFNGGVSKTGSLSFSSGPTITGTFTVSGNSATNRVLVQSSTTATARTITAAVVTISNADFMDITGAGAGSWNLVAITGNSGDCGGNSGITFTTAATQTWSGTSGGNWSANAWSGRVPLPQDDVIINAAFSGGQTISAEMPRLGKSIDFTGTTGSPTFSNTIATTVFGSYTLITGIGHTMAFATTFAGRGASYTITSAGKTFGSVITIVAPTATYTLQDAIATTSNVIVTAGVFVSNSQSITGASFQTTGTLTRSVTLGTSSISVTNVGVGANIFNIVSTGLTFSGASATFIVSTASANSRNFVGGGQSFGTLSYIVAGSTGALVISGANTFNTINFSDASNARALTLPASTTTTITNWNVSGTAGNLITVNSSTGGTPATLSKASGTVSSDYLSIQDSTATGGATWYAGANSTDVSGNTGWIFTAVPSDSTAATLLMMGVG